jgi:hypothetical protein
MAFIFERQVLGADQQTSLGKKGTEPKKRRVKAVILPAIGPGQRAGRPPESNLLFSSSRRNI